MQNVYKRFNVNKKYIWKKSKAIIISVLSFFGLVSPFFSLEDTKSEGSPLALTPRNNET